MSEPGEIGGCLRRLRRARGLSQEEVAERAGLSRDLVAKLEQGRRSSCRVTSLMKLANALDVELSELTGRRERLGTDRDGGSVLAIRDAIISPSLLPGLDGADEGEPAPLGELDAAVSRAWDSYWRGDFGALTAVVPGLIAEARITHRCLGVPAVPALAQAYQLAANLMVHLGRTDLAAISAERGIIVAAEGSDELQWAAVQATYVWALEHQARLREAEGLAVRVAGQIEPSFSSSPAHLSAWGNLLISAIGATVLINEQVTDRVAEYVSMASAGAERIGRTVATHRTTFGPAKVAMNEVHAYVVMKEPGKALEAAKRVRAEDLLRIARGHHLLDVAQAHADVRQPKAAIERLLRARDLSPMWFRHQETARSLVSDVREMERRPSPAIRSLARSVGLD